MEDTYAVHFERNPNTGQAEFAYFAIFDGHGGGEASNFAKNHLLAEIIKYESFWRSNDDNQVMEAIKLGFLDTHKLMAKELGTLIFCISFIFPCFHTFLKICFVLIYRAMILCVCVNDG